MSKDSVDQWSTTAASNTDVGGVDLGENTMRPSDVNNAIRTMMAQIASGVPFLTATTGYTFTSTSAFQPQIRVRNETNDANGPYFMVRKSRGTTNTAVQVSDTLGTFMFQGYDSTGTPVLRNGAYLAALVESVSAGAMAARFELVAGTSVWQFKTDGQLIAPGVITAASGTATPAGGSTAARLLFGTTAGFGVYYGSGAPTVSAGQGSIYLRSDGSSTSTRLYVNTNGSTTWTNVTTAA